MDISNLSYEDSIKELESIINFLENEDYSLDSAMDKFKKGVELYKHCSNLISKAEGEIKILLADEEKNFDDMNLLGEAEEDY